jgi:hypothetical protein
LIAELRQITRFAEELLQTDIEGIFATGIWEYLGSPRCPCCKLPRKELLYSDTNPQIYIPSQIGRAEASPTQQASHFEFSGKDASNAEYVARVID